MKSFILGLVMLVAIAGLASTVQAQQVQPSKAAITGIAAGDARIIAQWMIGNTFKASTTLVHVLPLTLFTITVPSFTLPKGSSTCPIAIGKDSLGNPHTGDPVKWSSPDTLVIRIGGAALSCPSSDTTVASPPLSSTLTRSPFQSAMRIR